MAKRGSFVSSESFLLSFPGRIFQVYGYMATHSQLLIRSMKQDSAPTRLDIAFFDVDRVNLPVHMNGFLMGSANKDWIVRISADANLSAGESGCFFVVRGSNYEGYVIASSFEVDESEKEDWGQDRWGIGFVSSR